MEQLPERAALIFKYDASAALAAPDNAEVLGWTNTDAVLGRFTVKILEDESSAAAQLTPERFKQLVNEVKAETGAKGKELFHPIRIVITGSHSGPEFDRLIPILEEGSRLTLPRHVLSVRERVEEFARQRAQKLEMWVGHSCPTLLTLNLNLTLILLSETCRSLPLDVQVNVKIKVKGVGQECPTHTS